MNVKRLEANGRVRPGSLAVKDTMCAKKSIYTGFCRFKSGYGSSIDESCLIDSENIDFQLSFLRIY